MTTESGEATTIRKLCRDVHETVLHEYWQGLRKQSTNPKEMATIAWEDRDWQEHPKHIPSEGFDARAVLYRYFIAVTDGTMNGRKDEWGVGCPR